MVSPFLQNSWDAPGFPGIKANISNLPPFVNGFQGFPGCPIFPEREGKFAEIRDLKHRLCYTLNRRTPKKRQGGATMKKRMLSLPLSAWFLLALCACGGGSAPTFDLHTETAYTPH